MGCRSHIWIPPSRSWRRSVAPGPHACRMGGSKRKSARSASRAQPGSTRQGSVNQPGVSQRVARLSAHELLDQIRYVRIERDEAEAELAILVDAAVRGGLGWPQIA